MLTIVGSLPGNVLLAGVELDRIDGFYVLFDPNDHVRSSETQQQNINLSPVSRAETATYSIVRIYCRNMWLVCAMSKDTCTHDCIPK